MTPLNHQITPLCLEILLHYFWSSEDYQQGDFSALAVREAIDHFRDRTKMLEAVPDELRHRTYRLTARGHAYIEHILSIPFPECRWEIPEPVAPIAFPAGVDPRPGSVSYMR